MRMVMSAPERDCRVTICMRIAGIILLWDGNMIIHNPRMFSTMDLFMKFLYGERSLYAINILYKKM